ncbi:MAG: type II toxin-antitoxin system VapC family toxin [Bacteroidetes bacterium]|nr:type II toxin-antitoxin system VapC family toxin [Bacteroidota bacterium]MBS1539903.1 type II toxin-antitoxin system VapC family toxin [Bacteroidota bacterium]
MESERFLIDSNSVIDYLGNKLPSKGVVFMNGVIDAVPNISVITKIEVLGFSANKKHTQLLEDFIADSNIILLTDPIINKCIELRKTYKKIKLPDAIIAATALVNQWKLISRNVEDFKALSELEIVNPHSL